MAELRKGLKISPNFKLKKKITSMNALNKALKEDKSLYVVLWKRTSPTAFLMSMQYRQLSKWVEWGAYWTIEPIDE